MDGKYTINVNKQNISYVKIICYVFHHSPHRQGELFSNRVDHRSDT